MPFAFKIDDQLDLGSLPMALPEIGAWPLEAHDPQYSPQSHLPVSFRVRRRGWMSRVLY